jgi:hypothetical protein
MNAALAARIALAAACCYEAAALAGAPVPTLTVICSRHRWLVPAVLVALALHLLRTPPPERSRSLRHVPGLGMPGGC